MEEEDKPVGEKPKSNLVEDAKALVAELKKEKEELMQVKEELQKLRSEQILSGTANAGDGMPQRSENDIKKEKLKEAWKGSAFEKAIEKHG